MLEVWYAFSAAGVLVSCERQVRLLALDVLGHVHVEGGSPLPLTLKAFAFVPDLVQLALTFPAAILAPPGRPLGKPNAGQGAHYAEGARGERNPEIYVRCGHCGIVSKGCQLQPARQQLRLIIAASHRIHPSMRTTRKPD